ncbi:hypothetical protein [Stappia sp.]|uniref:hypothetical protein n=1 Tax=Stappia sp. TaxID=1870903 RepID=UPI003A9A0C72
MQRATDELIEQFEKEGLGDEAAQYFERYPDSSRYLTFAELREQVIMQPVLARAEQHRELKRA